MNDLSHVTKDNLPTMVDVSQKTVSQRLAIASGEVVLGKEIMQRISKGEISSAKGPVFQTAIIGGTQAVKKTSEMIPFCHPIFLSSIKFEINPISDIAVKIECRVKTEGKTGVEMEALQGVSAAALCIYDMCKAMSHDIIISKIQLEKKTGGKADFDR